MTQIPKIVLDPNNDQELLEQALARTRSASNNILKDFSPGSVLSAIFEGVVFSIAELLYYFNLLPEATAIEVLRMAGVTRSAGTKAVGSLTFTMSQFTASSFFLPAGYEVSTNRGTTYALTADLSIPSGTTEGTVTVECRTLGSAGNAPSFGIFVNNPGLNFVQSIYNLQPITGGTDLEPMSQLLVRGQDALRLRGTLVSKADYEARVREILGATATATAIPLLSSNKVDYKAGHVHVFVLDSGNAEVGSGVTSVLQGELQEDSFAGASVWVSTAKLLDVDIIAAIRVSQISQTVALAALATLEAYLDPKVYPLGKTLKVKEVEYQIRKALEQTFGFDDDTQEVVSVSINGLTSNLLMPNLWTIPKVSALRLDMTNNLNQTQTFTVGSGIGDPD